MVQGKILSRLKFYCKSFKLKSDSVEILFKVSEVPQVHRHYFSEPAIVKPASKGNVRVRTKHTLVKTILL